VLGMVYLIIKLRKITNSRTYLCRLLGMVLIIVGLYYFLWGKRNEVPRLPQTNVAAAELSTSIADHSTVTQSSAVVVPSSLPNESVHLHINKTEKI